MMHANHLGPNAEHVLALRSRAEGLTVEEHDLTLYEAWRSAQGPLWDHAFKASIHASRKEGRIESWDRSRYVVSLIARDAAFQAAGAVSIRDLIGRHGFTQKHYDTLTGPWRSVIGPAHPDDEVTPQ